MRLLRGKSIITADTFSTSSTIVKQNFTHKHTHGVYVKKLNNNSNKNRGIKQLQDGERVATEKETQSK